MVARTHNKRTLLIVDDDAILRDMVRKQYQDEMLVLEACDGEAALHLCRSKKIDVVLLDQRLPDSEGHELCPRLLEFHDRIKIILITGYPCFDTAVAALKAGASDFISKPFATAELDLAVRRAARTLDLEAVEDLHSYEESKRKSGIKIIGGDGLREVRRGMELASQSDANVLVTGETGTGKSMFARAIHESSRRCQGPFVTINCAALPETLIESELFGHEKGAFSGACAMHKGLFEMADGGSIFLDEIGDMPLALQSRLLHVLEDRTVRRLGGTTLRPVDVRVIAATHADLPKAMDLGRFRSDLYHRLNVLRIHAPALRDRQSEIPELCRHLVSQIAGEKTVHLDQEDLAALTRYSWPGNIRELRNVLERAFLLREGQMLRPLQFLEPGSDQSEIRKRIPGEVLPLAVMEQQYIRQALEELDGNLSRTARALGISRTTLKRKLRAAPAAGLTPVAV